MFFTCHNSAVKDDPNFREYDFHQWDVVPLHSTITSDEQQRVFDKPRPFHRKIILSTNIAESSVSYIFKGLLLPTV